MRIKVLPIILLSIFLTGCSIDFSLPPEQTTHLSVYESGHTIVERTLDRNDPVRDAINHWLTANRDGWKYGFMTRDPQIYLAGETFSIDILKSEVAVKYCHHFYSCNLWVKKDAGLYLKIQSLLGSNKSAQYP